MSPLFFSPPLSELGFDHSIAKLLLPSPLIHFHSKTVEFDQHLVHVVGSGVELATGRLGAGLGPVLLVGTRHNALVLRRQAEGARVSGSVRLWHETDTAQRGIRNELGNVLDRVDLREGGGYVSQRQV